MVSEISGKTLLTAYKKAHFGIKGAKREAKREGTPPYVVVRGAQYAPYKFREEFLKNKLPI